MGTRFQRRPRLLGNLPFPVLNQPFIRGANRADLTTGIFAGLILPGDLQVDVTGTTSTVNLTAQDISTVVNDCNTQFAADASPATASNEGGFLVIRATGAGEGTYVHILGGSACDALGYPYSPDPYARVEADDIGTSPPYATDDEHPFYPTFIQQMEDVTPESVNRGFYQLAANDDELEYYLTRPLALPQILNVDPSAPAWAPHLVLDASGNIEQIDLSVLGDPAGPAPDLNDRIFVGNLSRTSTLRQIAGYFAVQDSRDVEIISGGMTVRVSAITHGQRVNPLLFPDEDSPPAAPLPDAADWTGGGGNVLGGGTVKAASAAITDVLYRSGVQANGATFLADGVRAGDKATIAGAGVTEPFNHDGEYRIEQVVHEDALLLKARGLDAMELNPSIAGPLGNVEVSVDQFADGVWMSFQPAIPAGRAFKLIYGVESSLAQINPDYLLDLIVRTSEEVDDLVQETIRRMKGPLVDSTDDFTAFPFAHTIPGGVSYAGEADVSQELQWRRTTMQGAYDGQGRGSGGGFYAQIDSRPPRWENRTPSTRAGTIERTGVAADILAGNVLHVPGEAFTLDDIGKTVILKWPGAAPLAVRDKAAFKLIDYLTSESAVLEPATHAPSIPVSSGYDYDLVTDRFDDFRSTHHAHALVPGVAGGRQGYVFTSDVDPNPINVPLGEGFLNLREASVHMHDSGQALSLVPATLPGGNNEIYLPFDPTTTRNIRAGHPSGEVLFGGWVFISNSPGNDGWYRLLEKRGVHKGDANNLVTVADLDGNYPSFVADLTAAPRVHFYYSVMSSSTFEALDPAAIISGNSPLGTLLHEDFIEGGPHYSASGVRVPEGWGALGISWRGEAFGGIWGILNDAAFDALDNGDGAEGPAVRFYSYTPAYGAHFAHEAAPISYPSTYRGGFAGTFVARTRSQDRNSASFAGTPGGWAVMAVQKGWDPALLVGSVDDVSTITNYKWSNITPLVSWAAQVGAAETDMTQLQNGYLEFLGAAYQRKPSAWWDTTRRYGGFYSEMSGAFRHALYPMAIESTRDNGRYHASRTWSRLGHRGEIYEPSPTLSTAPPDPAVSRSHDSSGFVSIAGVQLLGTSDQYIGCHVLLDDVTDPSPAGMSGWYTIINVITDGSQADPTLVEVLGTKTLTARAAPTGVVAAIHGSRWHYGHVDQAQFMMIGTESHLNPGAAILALRQAPEMPVLGVWATQPYALGPTSTGPQGYSDIEAEIDAGGEPAYPAYGYQTHVQRVSPTLVDQPYGVGFGGLQWVISDPHYVGEEPFLNLGWGGMYRRARPIGPAGGPFRDMDRSSTEIMNFWNSEYVFFTRDFGVVLSPANFFNLTYVGQVDSGLFPEAMMLHIESTSASWSLSDDMVGFVSKGQRVLRENHYHVEVQIELQVVGSPGFGNEFDMNVRLIADDGATLGDQVVSVHNNDLDRAAMTFTLDNLREGNIDVYEDFTTFRLEVTLGALTYSAAAAGELDLHFRRIIIHTGQETSVHQGALVVEGPIIAQGGFHAASPIRDYLTIGPAEADLYVPNGYANEPPVIDTGDYTGKPFGSAGEDEPMAYPVEPPGRALLRTAYKDGDIDKNFYALVEAEDCLDFKKGPEAASIRFLSKVLDPFVYSSGWPNPPLQGQTHYICPPGRVGFIVPLRLPHAALLTELDLVMSFKPSYTFDEHGSGGPTIIDGAWNIWHARQGIHQQTEDGVRVRLCRQHLFPDTDRAYERIGSEDAMRDWGFRNGYHAKTFQGGRDVWDYPEEHHRIGFHEVLLRTYVSLRGDMHRIDAGDPNVNWVGHTLPTMLNQTKEEMQIGREIMVTRKWFSQTEECGADPDSLVPNPHSWVSGDPGYETPDMASPEKFLVDTRQFAYYLIIDAWGSPGYNPSGGQALLSDTHVPPNMIQSPDPFEMEWFYTGHFQPAMNDAIKPDTPPWVRGYRVQPQLITGEWETPLHYYALMATPMMKFRGARCGFEWTRVRPG
jgi:hypothetical protein